MRVTLVEAPGRGAVSIAADGRSITFDPGGDFDFLAPGDDETVAIAYQIADFQGGVTSATFAFTVTGANDAPTLATSLADQSATEDEALSFTLPADAFTDVDEDDRLTLTATLLDGSPLPSWLDFDPETRTFAGTPGNDDVGPVTVRVTARDRDGASVSDDFTLTVENVNDAPTGAVTIAGVATEDEVLRVSNTLADADGLGRISYQWQRSVEGGEFADIPGETGESYALGDTDVGASLRVVASYIDQRGEVETVTSAATATVANINDAPDIDQVDLTGTVEEDPRGVSQATGDLSVSDPDGGDTQTWRIVGGPERPVDDYRYAVDQLTIRRRQPDLGETDFRSIFTDGFDDGAAPPSAPNFADGTATSYNNETGTILEENGRAVLNESLGTLSSSIGGGSVLGQFATLRSNIDPSTLDRGLRVNDDFRVEARFDLAEPSVRGEVYGIRLTDRFIGNRGANQPSDNPGDDIIELVVRRAQDDGLLRVQLREIDNVANTVTNIASRSYVPPVGATQIVLRLLHDADTPGRVTAAFDYLNADGAVVGSTQTIPGQAQIFGRETPDNATDDEVWTRAQIVAYTPATTLHGVYGSLTIDQQSGAWTYNLDNARAATQALGATDTREEEFIVQVMDAADESDTGTITVTVTGANDAPVGGDASFATTEDSPRFGWALPTARDAEGDTITYALPARSAHGTLTDRGLQSGSFQFDYAPDANFNGTDSFTYTVSDPGGAATTHTVTVSVATVNDAPVFTVPAGAVSGEEDGAIAFTSANAIRVTDVDGDGGELSINANVSHGSLAATPSGTARVSGTGGSVFNTFIIRGSLADVNDTLATLTYRGKAEFNGDDTLNIRVFDASGGNDVENVAITVNPVGPEFDSADDLYDETVREDVAAGAVVATVRATDAGSSAGIIYTLVDDRGGRFAIDANTGRIRVQQDNVFDYENPDASSFQLQVDAARSGTTETDRATVLISASDVNDAPVARQDQIVTDEETIATGNLFADNGLGADSDPDGDPLTVVALNGSAAAVGTQITLGSGAKLLVRADGTLEFDPRGAFDFVAQGYGSADNFTYTVADPSGASSSVLAVMSVQGVNDAPILDATKTPVMNPVGEDAGAPRGAVGTLVSSLIDRQGGGGLDNLRDPDSVSLAGLALTGVDRANGAWFYSTNNGGTWQAVDTVSDSSALLLAADPNTRLYFQPNPNFNGTVANGVTFRAWDQTSGAAGPYVAATAAGGTTAFSTASDSASITVTPVNDAPSFVTPQAGLNYTDTAADNTFNPAGGTFTAADPDSDTLIFDIVGGTQGSGTALGISYDVYKTSDLGTLYLNETSGAFRFQTNDAAMEATTSATTNIFGISVSDGAASASHDFRVTVNGANDTPVAVNDTATTQEGRRVTINVLTNDSDRDAGSVLTIRSATISSGTGSDDAIFIAQDRRSIEYVPGFNVPAGQTGQATISYEVEDQFFAFAPAIVTVTVTDASF